MARRGSSATRALPAVDDRLVMPESGIEILEGEVLTVPGADPPHAAHHSRLAYMLEAHVADGFRAAIDMLTRTSEVSDFAPDASVYPEGPDVRTGGRRLEVLAFEIVSKQALAVPTRKARELSRRGVERIFAIVLARKRVLEWDAATDRFQPMHLDAVISEPCLAVSISVRDLVDTARMDAAVWAALEARHPELADRIRAVAEARGEARGEVRGEARGEARAALETRRSILLSSCAKLGIDVPAADRERLPTASTEALERLLDAVIVARRWPGWPGE